jgi:hypothetical protein
MDGSIRFELDRLVSYDDASLLEEVRRVAALVPGRTLTRTEFDRHARVDSSTIVRRLGGWQDALKQAGMADRYSGRTVSDSMRVQRAKNLTDEELLDELRQVAAALGKQVLTREEFREGSRGVSSSAIDRRFGSWSEGLRLAGLELSPLGRRWTDDDYFENLLTVWTHHGRAPRYREMNEPPSLITGGAYEAKFGTWGRAKAAFVERVNSDLSRRKKTAARPTGEQLTLPDTKSPRREDGRSPSLGLRYKVLSRDHFRCVTCGRSPATTLSVKLHVDHILPVAAGGKTVEENLRALCADCNLGKGARVVSGTVS